MTDKEVITQDLLSDYAEACAALVAITAAKSALREHILGLLEKGAVTENGPLVAWIEKRSRKSLTWVSLAGIVGEDEAARIKDEATPKDVKFLIVKDAKKKGEGDEREGWREE